MSGIDGFGGAASSVGSCQTLVIDTFIASPKPKASLSLSVGLSLDVMLGQDQGFVVVQVWHEKNLVGGLASPAIQTLRRCLEDGTQYAAKIISINLGEVRVRISAK